MILDLKKISFEDFCTVFGNDSIEMRLAIDACGDGADLGDLWQMTIKDLGGLLEGRLPVCFTKMLDIKQTAYSYLKKRNTINSFFEMYLRLMSRYTSHGTSEEQQASFGLPKFENSEGFLVFAREYFGLKSFTEAENVTLADLYLARKDAYIREMQQRNYNKIIENKYKSHKR